jgi:hypothetical protein
MAGMISKARFHEQLEIILEKERRSRHMTESRARLIREKGEQLQNLFIGLDRRDLLRPPGQVDFKRIGNVLRNFVQVNNLNATLMRLYKGHRGQGGMRAGLPFRDDVGKRHSITMEQLVIQWGWAYCALCEVVKTILTEIVVFEKRPTGIGEVILALEAYKGLDLSYFDFVEPRVRNSFFHLDFCLEGENIMIAGLPEPLKVGELIERTMRIDTAIFPLMGIIRLYFKAP